MTATADLGFADHLAVHGDRLALVTQAGSLTYRDLDQRVAAAAERLGTTRRLVLLAAENDVESLVVYLAALRGRHPVVLAAANQVPALTAAYDPDVVISGSWTERHEGTVHSLHPELALLLSTSGTTGSPKLVRLSADNLAANAASIGTYLDVRASDRAITSLPLHYCYGLSVVNSNLARGAGLVLTGRSVIEPEFWDLVREHGVTSLHGVPHTFGLLDGIGFADLDLPSLRYVTQAGGRLAPDDVVRYASLGAERGWRFFVMYGQTEATARMAFLPAELAAAHPSAIGVPVPGGRLRIDDGELVYSGPNVMLGYACSPEDLALGRTTFELRTGDLGTESDGLFSVTGRKSRFVKPFGLRIDLDRVERSLAADGLRVACTGDDDGLVLAVLGSADRAARLAGALTGLPAAAVRAYSVTSLPLLSNGKVDYQAVAAPPEREWTSVREVFSSVLGVRSVPSDATFNSLGGDSLRYVQLTVQLQRLLGDLPTSWPTMPVSRLEELRATHRRIPMVDTTIVLRALAILLIVGSHVGFFKLLGGAHLLLVVAGWNLARFLMPADPLRILRATATIAVPTSLWLGYRVAVTDDVTLDNVALVNNFTRVGAAGYWFVEVLVHVLLLCALVFAVPAIRRWEQRHGYAFALALLGLTLALRLTVDGDFFARNMTTLGAAWFVALGWLAHRSPALWQKGLVVVVAVAMVPGRMEDLSREIVVISGLVLLLSLARVPVPRGLLTPMSLLASASLAIYLTHYAVFPLLQPQVPAAIVWVVCVVVGCAMWLGIDRAVTAVR
ncbi:Acyl-CoA synthetase (AMP-forming)/AMP-acid ligase II [Lentzea waywayandensis]|uniref:Acyl-CoA synthetase (AMP-forming)/AMP-acid ligase II n=1 Tax=Lentzea waywayandensis TaxID=84724 RepID=A0A1I6FIP6_9PSEU|nr:non-ribosomal peptide synthetase [Lentzea waywayandensis]SFR29802.1 Acyl-CoA synthetase (AMP-forming)/AMP-acid ligase II [Lentzea waywayandensis]